MGVVPEVAFDGNLADGVLTINMDVVIPEEDKPKVIKIGNASQEFLAEKSKK